MAKRTKVEGISGTRVVSTPGARMVDTNAAPTQSNLGDLSNALNDLNPKLQAYGDKERAIKHKLEIDQIDGLAISFVAENKGNIVGAVRAGDIHPSDSVIVQSSFKQAIGKKYGKEFAANLRLEMEALPHLATDKEARDAYIATAYEKGDANQKGLPFMSAGWRTGFESEMNIYRNNANQQQTKLTNEVFAEDLKDSITEIFNNGDLTIQGMSNALKNLDTSTNEGGSTLTGPARSEIVVDTLIAYAKNLATTDPEKALALFGTRNEKTGALEGGALPGMLGESNLLGDVNVQNDLNDAYDSIQDDIDAKVVSDEKANAAIFDDTLGQITDEFNRGREQNPSNFRSMNQIMEQDFKEQINNPDLIGLRSKAVDYADKKRNVPVVNKWDSLTNKGQVINHWRYMSFRGKTRFDLETPEGQAMAEIFPEGETPNLSYENALAVTEIYQMNIEDTKLFLNDAAKIKQNLGSIEAQNKKNSGRSAAMSRIKLMFTQKNFARALKKAGRKNIDFNAEVEILGVYDAVLADREADYWDEHGTPPPYHERIQIEKDAAEAMEHEAREWKELLVEETAINKNTKLSKAQKEQAKADLPQPSDNGYLEQTVRIGEIVDTTLTLDSIKELFPGSPFLPGAVEMTRVAESARREPDGFYFEQNGVTYKVSQDAQDLDTLLETVIK